MGFLKDIETYILSADTLADLGVPSVSIAWLDNPSSNLQSHTISNGRETTETIYQACSISKAITALAVAKLVDQGKLSYETKVIDFIPKSILDSIGSEHLMRHVTVAKLLSHTSGLSQRRFPGYASERLPTCEEVFAGRPPANTPRVRFSSLPGSEMSYSGGGYTLLQVFLENFTGLDFASFMRQTVFIPLGMTRSVYGLLPPEENNYARANYIAHTRGTTDTTGRGYHRFTELAATGLWSTPSDLVKATSAIQTSLRPGSPGSFQPFLSQQTVQSMLTVASPRPSDISRRIGMGWFSDSTFFAHAGDDDPGYTCYLIACHSAPALIPGDATIRPPDLLFNLAVMTNSTLGFPIIKKLILNLFAMKQVPFYPTLPGISSTTDVVPLLVPEGISFSGWEPWIGHWIIHSLGECHDRVPTERIGCLPGRRNQSNAFHEISVQLNAFHEMHTNFFPADRQDIFSRHEDEWEIYEDEGSPMVAWDGLEMPHRLLLAASPMPIVEGVRGFFFRIEGVEMGIRLVPGTNGEKWIEIVGSEVKFLRRSNGHVAEPQWQQWP